MSKYEKLTVDTMEKNNQWGKLILLNGENEDDAIVTKNKII